MLVKITDSDYPHNEIERAVVEQAGGRLVKCACRTESDVIAQCADADGLLVQYAPMTRAVLAHLPRCRVIARYGVGVDCVDLQAAAEQGIVVANVPDYCMHEVAEHALAFIFALGRKLLVSHRDVLAGGWGHARVQPIFRLYGQTLGLVGFGQIARRLAAKAIGIGFKVMAYDPYVPAETMRQAGVEPAGLEALLAASDFVSLHAPATPETEKLINARTLRLMKKTAYLINAARGALVDEPALVEALQQGTIAGAGIDTTRRDPIEPDNPLLKLPNVILTGHIGWHSTDSLVDLERMTAEAAVAVLQGREPRSWVNRRAMEAAGVVPRFRR